VWEECAGHSWSIHWASSRGCKACPGAAAAWRVAPVKAAIVWLLLLLLLQGYAFQMEVVVRGRQLGYTVEEVRCWCGCIVHLVDIVASDLNACRNHLQR
jgi:hypothetical protein